MRVRRSWHCLIALGLITLILTACSSPSGSPRPDSESVKMLRYADQNSPGGWEVVHAAQPWLEQIQDSTDGLIQIEPYYSETLVKGAHSWDAVRNDVADMAWMFHGYWAEKTPLANVMTLPLLPFTSARQASGIFWQLYQKYPRLRGQFNANHVLLLWASTPYFLTTTSKQVKTLEDIKGLSIRIPTGPPEQIMHDLGAIPVNAGMPDLYLYLQKGIVDGMATSWESLLSFRQYQLVKYYTYIPLFTVYFSQAINDSVWNSLSQSQKSGINSVSGLRGSLFWGENMFDTAAEVGRDTVKNQGFEMVEYTLPSDELARWSAVAKPLWDGWVQKMTLSGYPEAQEILDTTLELIRTYQPRSY